LTFVSLAACVTSFTNTMNSGMFKGTHMFIAIFETNLKYDETNIIVRQHTSAWFNYVQCTQS